MLCLGWPAVSPGEVLLPPEEEQRAQEVRPAAGQSRSSLIQVAHVTNQRCNQNMCVSSNVPPLLRGLSWTGGKVLEIRPATLVLTSLRPRLRLQWKDDEAATNSLEEPAQLNDARVTVSVGRRLLRNNRAPQFTVHAAQVRGACMGRVHGLTSNPRLLD